MLQELLNTSKLHAISVYVSPRESKMAKKLFLSVLCALPMLSQATSFDLPASVMSNLAPTQDTIRVTANTTIAKGASLTINAGKIVRVGGEYTITVKGALRLLGTQTDSVRIEALDPDWDLNRAWDGIHLLNGSNEMGTDSTILNYVSIREAGKSALVVESFDRVRVSHSCFHHNTNRRQSLNTRPGSAISVKNSSFLITHSKFDSNQDSTETARGGAIYWNDGVATIRNSVFHGNSATLGGAIYAEHMDSLVLEHSRFSNNAFNYGARGGSLHLDSSRAYIRNSSFEYGAATINSVSQVGAAIYDNGGVVFHMEQDTVTGFRGASKAGPVYVNADSIKVVNSVFYNNQINRTPADALSGGAISANGRAIVLSGILAYHNAADQGGFASVKATGHCQINHCTLVNNTVANYKLLHVPTGGKRPAVHGNLSWGAGGLDDYYGAFNVGSSNNGPYPMFVDSAAGDFRLSASSPYIDRGYALASDIPPVDLDGNPRSVHQSIDPGAYEYQGTRPAGFRGVFTRDTLIAKGNYTSTGLCPVVLDGVTMRVAAGTKLLFTDNCLDVYGSLRVEGTAADPVVFTSTSNPGWNGVRIHDRSWNQLTDTDSSALRHLNLENANSPAILQKSNAVASYSHVDFPGLDFQAEAYSRAYMDTCQFHETGASLVSNATLKGTGSSVIGPGTNATIQGQSGTSGGGAYLHGWLFENTPITISSGTNTFRNTIFKTSPITSSGSGTGALTLINSLVYGNVANTPAIQVGGNLRVYHSTIADNAYYGIKTGLTGSFTLRNSILWGNYGGSGSPQMDLGSLVTSTIANSIIQTGWIGTAIQDADPLFKDPASGDYSLSAPSPAINAGDSTEMVSIVGDLDLAGKTRFMDSAMDLGPYEFQAGSPVSNSYRRPSPYRQAIHLPPFDLLGRQRSLER